MSLWKQTLFLHNSEAFDDNSIDSNERMKVVAVNKEHQTASIIMNVLYTSSFAAVQRHKENKSVWRRYTRHHVKFLMRCNGQAYTLFTFYIGFLANFLNKLNLIRSTLTNTLLFTNCQQASEEATSEEQVLRCGCRWRYPVPHPFSWICPCLFIVHVTYAWY